MSRDQIGVLLGFLFFAAIIGIDIVVFAWIYRQRRKADRICRELIERQINEIKMVAYAKFVRSAGFNQNGILAMFNDRVVFRPLGRGQILEMPLAQISRVSTGRFGSGMGVIKKLEFELGNQRLRFYIPPLVSSAWREAIEKTMPAISPRPIG